MVFRESQVIRASFIDEREPAGRRSVPGVRRNHVESRLEVCLEVLRREVQNLPELAHSAFRPLAFLDIDARSIPFDDLSGLVAESYFMMQHPAILPVCPTHTRLELQWLA